jgi:putative transposase
VTELAPQVGIAAACRLLDVPRSSYYRGSQPAPPTPRPRSPRTLTDTEHDHIRTVLNRPRFADCTPCQIYATLLDEGTYLCHWRTFYRLLAAHDEVLERRNQLRHPAYAAPELLTTRPNQLWSWDITNSRGRAPGRMFTCTSS